MDSALCIFIKSCELVTGSISNLDSYIYSVLARQVLESVPAVGTREAGIHLHLAASSNQARIHFLLKRVKPNSRNHR